MVTETNPAAETYTLTDAINDVREDINSIEAGIQDLEASIPETHSVEFRFDSNKDRITGTRVQIRMDKEYLALRRSDLRRLESMARGHARRERLAA